LNRFTPWTNRLEIPDDQLDKVKDIKKQIKRIEFRDGQPIEKLFESRVIESNVLVTKDFFERRKKNPIKDAIGLES